MTIRYSLTRRLIINFTAVEFWIAIEKPGLDGWNTHKFLTFWRKVE